MNVKNIPIKPKKIPYYLILSFLTGGASLILGLLSFSGMFALFPVLSIAFASFGLSVAYEGEIYLQNIRGALNKLFKENYLKNYLAKEFLLKNFPQYSDIEFFKDYEAQLRLLEQFGHQELDAQSRLHKRHIEKTLGDMEKWFAKQLFVAEDDARIASPYEAAIRAWLHTQNQSEWVERMQSRRFIFNTVKVFSTLAAVFMALGSSYLILEAFLVIPALAVIPFTVLPLIIVPMALIAGAAYGMLTYNAVTDLINNNTLIKWYSKLRQDMSQGLTVRNLFMASIAVLLVGLAVALTICTAGTWWTIATSARPLFEWMKTMPSFVMGAINPAITGLSAISFNIQNTAESLDMVDEAIQNKKSIWQRISEYATKVYANLRKSENWVQLFNPFRIILKLTVMPLRIVLFIGHLLSIAVTADRMPGLPQVISALIALISEGFEDAHYFIPGGHHHHHQNEHEKDHPKKHQHADKTGQEAAGQETSHKYHHHKHCEHSIQSLLSERLGGQAGHNHNTDIPTLILKGVSAPLYALATLWDYAASKLNSIPAQADNKATVLSLRKAWDKQRGNEKEHHIELGNEAGHLSKNWQREHAVFRIDSFRHKHLQHVLVGRTLAEAKSIALDGLKTKIRSTDAEISLADTLKAARQESVYNQHRMFGANDKKTNTQEFVETLAQRIGLS